MIVNAVQPLPLHTVIKMIPQRSIEVLAAKEHLDEAKLQDCKAKANLVAARSKIANTESTRQVKLAALHQAKV